MEPPIITNGITTITLSSWREFTSVINQRFLDLPNYIWRGHRTTNWRLEPTLHRLLRGRADKESLRADHLNNFRYALRGRRGPHPSELSENELWAIGQHSFLATPLLDWSSSPYVALFFAFADEDDSDSTGHRVVFTLNEGRIKEKNYELIENNISFLRPLSDENSRLVNQAGLFTYTDPETEIEPWVSENFHNANDRVILGKFLIPNSEREECLKALNLMNINYATLFPDLFGASKHCNLKLKIHNY